MLLVAVHWLPDDPAWRPLKVHATLNVGLMRVILLCHHTATGLRAGCDNSEPEQGVELCNLSDVAAVTL